MQARSQTSRFVELAFIAISLICAAETASAQLVVTRFSVDGGGGNGSGGTYALVGTIGQPDAGRMAGAALTLTGGFLAAGGGTVSGVQDGSPGPDTAPSVPLVFHMRPASPNPVEETMVLAFDLPEARSVRAGVYDAVGRLVRVLVDGVVPAGRNQRSWDRRDQQGERVPAGIYFVRLDAGPDRTHQKVVVIS